MREDDYKVYKSEVSSDNNLKIRQKSVFLSNINVKNRIISYEDLIVFGDVNAEYLLVRGNLIVSGKINVKEIDIEGSLIYAHPDKLEKLDVEGKIISADILKNNENAFDIEKISIKNIQDYNGFLSDINNMKLKLIKEICDNESNYFLEQIYNKFKPLEDVFVEFKNYNAFVLLLINKYGHASKYNMELINYLRVINYKYELPKWLLDISPIKLTLILIEKLNINDMSINFEDKEEINEIKYMTYRCEKILDNKFEQIMSKINTNKSDDESNKTISKTNTNENIETDSLISKINTNERVKKDVLMDELFEKYSKKEKNYELIEGRIENIKQTRIELEIEDKVKAVLIDYYDIGDKSKYRIGDKIQVGILKIHKSKSKLEIDAYRNSVKCMYESICKLHIPSLENIKKSDLEIVDNKELFIINYVGKRTDVVEKMINNTKIIEETIKDKLLLKNIKILHTLDSKTKNISKMFNINEDLISKVSNREYKIKTYSVEQSNTVNKLCAKYKKLLLCIGVESVMPDNISIQKKSNLHSNKIGNLIEGKIRIVNDDEYTIDTKDNTMAVLSKINANQEYSVGSKIIAKVEGITVGNMYNYLRLNNNYDNYIKDLVDYKIRELNIKNMIDEVKIEFDVIKGYDIKFVLNNTYDEALINTLKKDIEINNKNKKIVFTTVFSKNNINNVNNLAQSVEKENKLNDYLNKDISLSEIIKMFNKKKKECGVPEIRVIKNARIEKYKTVIICSKLVLNKDKTRLLSLEYDMEFELKGEKIKIVVYDEDIKSMVADILSLEKQDLEVNKNARNIKIMMDKKAYSKLDIRKEKALLSMILPYYKIEFLVKDEESNKENIVSKSNKKQEDVVDDILDILFK